MNVSNQMPQVLSPLYDLTIDDAFDPLALLRHNVAEPVCTPLVAGTDASIVADDGTSLDVDDITHMVAACLGDGVDPAAEATAKDLLGRTCIGYNASTNTTIDQMFVAMAATRARLPEPSPLVIYNEFDDVIGASREWLQGRIDNDALVGHIGYYARADTLAFAFKSQASFDGFKAFANAEVGSIAAGLPPETTRTWRSFDNDVKLDSLTESMWLRKSDTEGNEPYSFPRLLISLMMTYAKAHADEVVCIPFSAQRLYVPESLVLMNIDAHAHVRNAGAIAREWSLIRDSITDDVRVMTQGQIQSLTAARRAMQRARAQAVTAADAKNMAATRSVDIKFRRRPPTHVDLAHTVTKLMKRMAFVNHSENVYKATKMSYARPSRRDPDDFNRQGKVVSTRYLPDIHLYVDTSGSIDESQYHDAVMAMIQLVRKMDVSLYFNSFSHVMSTTTFLPTRGRSAAQVWNQLQHVHKVGGGTNFSQIWEYVLASKKRRRELSIIITDFEWSPPVQWANHPRNVYYVPISTAVDDWPEMVRSMQTFVNAMRHIDPSIRNKILT